MFLEKKTYVSITTDCWTSSNNESFMSITAHFIDTDFTIQSTLLSCSIFYQNHTSENLAKELLAVIAEWGLNGRVVLAISDNAANIKSAIRNSTPWKFLGCYAHTLNLVVTDALKTPNVNCTIDKVKTIVTHFKRSTKANQKLITNQKNSGIINPKKIVQDVVTRWNSTLYMVERFVELESSIRSTIAVLDVDLPILTGEEWQFLKELCRILSPFESATRAVSGELYMSASLVIVLTNGLLDICQKLLKEDALLDLTKIIVKKLHDSLQERNNNIEYSNTLAVCTFLDPRFKAYPFKNADAVENVRKSISASLSAIIGKENPNIEPEANETAASSTATTSTELGLSVWSSFDGLMTGKQKKTINATSRALMEFQRYMEEDVLERLQNPLIWWRENSYMFPNLAKLVRQKCCAVATSVPCERVFLKQGNF